MVAASIPIATFINIPAVMVTAAKDFKPGVASAAVVTVLVYADLNNMIKVYSYQINVHLFVMNFTSKKGK